MTLNISFEIEITFVFQFSASLKISHGFTEVMCVIWCTDGPNGV